ncbi:hypothetical protein TYRP_023549 [Tyrophagus putrescentiae]|nr:hypothetical protein TYRP_023549 [Tyrophagus putrescentiae]
MLSSEYWQTCFNDGVSEAAIVELLSVNSDLLAHFCATHISYPKVLVFNPAERVNCLLYRCLFKNCSKLMPTVEDFSTHLIVHKLKKVDLAETAESSTPSTNQVPNKKRKYRCKKCYQLFLKQADLEEHTTTDNHHFQCTLCEEKVFVSDAHLKRHLSVSHGVTFKCDYCEKVFKTADTLKVHSVIHLRQKPFVCEICKRAFHRKDHLKRHSLVHSSVKEYKCDKCHWEFSRLDKLKEHIMTHSGARPYQQQVETESSGKGGGIDQQQQLLKIQTFFDDGNSAIFIAKN